MKTLKTIAFVFIAAVLMGATGRMLGNRLLVDELKIAEGASSGTCTLNGGSPSTCTDTVVASTKCTCSSVGATAVIAAAGCAVGLSGTTLTITSGATLTHDVNWNCF